MKKLILLNAMLFSCIFISKAQIQQSYTNTIGGTSVSSVNYSIETAPDGAPYSFACAGTFFYASTTYMHVFTTDLGGTIFWENYIPISGVDGRALDVAIDENFNVAITGFVDAGGAGSNLYAALYSGSTGGLLNDFIYTGSINSAGNHIYYSYNTRQFVIGGIESVGYTLSGNALLIALDPGFNLVWASTYNSQVDDFYMSSINSIIDLNDGYFITGNSSASLAPYPLGQSQVVAAVVDAGSGSILDNESFVATGYTAQQAMGVASYFDAENEQLVLLYNVSNAYTDETRPYLAVYSVAGTNLTYSTGYRIDNTFLSNPNNFVSNPSFTGLAIQRNVENDSYVIFGMLEAYGQANEDVVSVYQEIDINAGTLVSMARYWTDSYIPAGYPVQETFFSFFDALILNSKVYTPANTSHHPELNNYVSILPAPDGSNFAYNIISSTLNTASADSPCLPEFEVEILTHHPDNLLELEHATPSYSLSNPNYTESMHISNMTPACPIFMAPVLGLAAENKVENELTILVNPVIDVLTFNSSLEGQFQVLITTMQGQIVLNEQMNNGGAQNEIDVHDFESGIYILSVIDNKGQSIHKYFVKQ